MSFLLPLLVRGSLPPSPEEDFNEPDTKFQVVCPQKHGCVSKTATTVVFWQSTIYWPRVRAQQQTRHQTNQQHWMLPSPQSRLKAGENTAVLSRSRPTIHFYGCVSLPPSSSTEAVLIWIFYWYSAGPAFFCFLPKKPSTSRRSSILRYGPTDKKRLIRTRLGNPTATPTLSNPEHSQMAMLVGV